VAAAQVIEDEGILVHVKVLAKGAAGIGFRGGGNEPGADAVSVMAPHGGLVEERDVVVLGVDGGAVGKGRAVRMAPGFIAEISALGNLLEIFIADLFPGAFVGPAWSSMPMSNLYMVRISPFWFPLMIT